jgi:hypothetical protein
MFKTNKRYLGILKNKKNKDEIFYLNKLNFLLLSIFLITGINNDFYKNNTFKLEKNTKSLNFKQINFEEDGTYKIGILRDLNLEEINLDVLYDINLSIQINKPNLFIFDGNIISKNCKKLSVIHSLNSIMINNNIKLIYNLGDNEIENIYLKDKIPKYFNYLSNTYKDIYINHYDELISLVNNNQIYYHIHLFNKNDDNFQYYYFSHILNKCLFEDNFNGFLLINNKENKFTNEVVQIINNCGNSKILENFNEKNQKINYFLLNNYGKKINEKKVNLKLIK